VKHVTITSPLHDLREVVRRRAEQCIYIMKELPMSSGAWQKEKENARYEAFRTILADIDRALKDEGC
jgi:hypothetical protein